MSQLSTAISLFSALSVAGLGFLLALLGRENFKPLGWTALAFLTAIGCFFIASALSVAAVVTRLLDFRLTAQKAKTNNSAEPLTQFGTDATGYGKATWRLFWGVLITFFLASVLSAIVVLNVYVGGFIQSAEL